MKRLMLCAAMLGLTAALVQVDAAQRPNAMARKASMLVIPHLDVEDMPLIEVIRHLRKESRRLDPERKGVNFFIKFHPARAQQTKQRLVSMSFTKLSIEEIVKYLCLTTGLQYRMEESAILIADKSVAIDKMETRFYNVAAGVLDSEKTRPRTKSLWFDEDDDKDD